MRTSNTSPNPWRLFRRLRRLACAIALCAADASAIDPNRAVTQYARDRWSSEQGFPAGAVHAIVQTPDGYLWIGSESGLYRFDGFTFRRISVPDSLPIASVLGLAVDADGYLWIRLAGSTLLRYKNGAFEDAALKLGMPYSNVTALGNTASASLLIARLEPGLLTHSQGRFSTIAGAVPAARSPIISVAQTANGDIWMGTRDAGVFRMARNGIAPVPDRLPDSKINFLLPDDRNRLWIATDDGVSLWDSSGHIRTDSMRALRGFQALAMLRDRDANLWIGTDSRGLLRFNSNGVVSLSSADGDSRGSVTALFEDREGNIWIGRSDSLERLRETAFVTYSQAEGLPISANMSLFPDSDGRLWFAPATGGLRWLHDGRQGNVRIDDVIYSIAGDSTELWLGRQRGGLTRLSLTDAGLISRTYTRNEGLAANTVYSVHKARDGAVWAGTLTGGVSRLVKGRIETFTTAHGLGANSVASIQEAADGTMWFATAAGVTSLSHGRWTTYDTKAGLPGANAICLLEDSKGVLWAGTAGGLAYYRSGNFHVPTKALIAPNEQVIGIAEDRLGSLWIATSSRVLRVTRDKLVRGDLSEEDVREYGQADGLHSTHVVKRHRSVVMDKQGRAWFSTAHGISVVDPGRLASRGVPAVIQVQGVTVDGSPIRLDESTRIPAGHRRVRISYAGLSLSVPERIRFRYRLHGFDERWSDIVGQREAVYTNLSPGPYTFQVMASNSEGIWNGDEAALRFEVEHAFWQTWWFRGVTMLICAACILGIYRYRLHQVSVRMNVRFEERLAERTRVAQDLHDTLLQGFLSAWMRLHVLDDELPAGSVGKLTLARTIELVGRVIEEGRIAVKGLRSPGLGGDVDLGRALSAIQQDLDLEPRIDMRVSIVGEPQPLRAAVRDDVYRIGREAVVNAFRHSGAQFIELQLQYTSSDLRVIVRDNGRGMEPRFLPHGREAHWGLQGMRERAARIGARLLISSNGAEGTEVELIVPGRIAFPSETGFAGSRLWKRWLGRRSVDKLFT